MNKTGNRLPQRHRGTEISGVMLVHADDRNSSLCVSVPLWSMLWIPA